jgi:hypothetical protein
MIRIKRTLFFASSAKSVAPTGLKNNAKHMIESDLCDPKGPKTMCFSSHQFAVDTSALHLNHEDLQERKELRNPARQAGSNSGFRLGRSLLAGAAGTSAWKTTFKSRDRTLRSTEIHCYPIPDALVPAAPARRGFRSAAAEAPPAPPMPSALTGS